MQKVFTAAATTTPTTTMTEATAVALGEVHPVRYPASPHLLPLRMQRFCRPTFVIAMRSETSPSPTFTAKFELMFHVKVYVRVYVCVGAYVCECVCCINFASTFA